MGESAKIAKEEERTQQGELELEKIKVHLEMERTKSQSQYKILKIQAHTAERKMKLEAKERDRQRKHELRMAMLNQGNSGQAFPQNSNFMQGSSNLGGHGSGSSFDMGVNDWDDPFPSLPPGT